ncbi:hypothetical protein ACTWPT_43635 [Nonomuraea sp. 3N208]|uniref:hypothetical protein n=1 Tax=Nonomuraea sp. 3N208 TaxID=3457421 RepID=UPI003FD55DEE
MLSPSTPSASRTSTAARMICSLVKRPRRVVLAATLQLLSAVPFLLGTYVVLVHGAGAQAAAEAEVARQGLPPSVLAEHGISFGSNTAELPFAIAIVLILATLAYFRGKAL